MKHYLAIILILLLIAAGLYAVSRKTPAPQPVVQKQASGDQQPERPAAEPQPAEERKETGRIQQPAKQPRRGAARPDTSGASPALARIPTETPKVIEALRPSPSTPTPAAPVFSAAQPARPVRAPEATCEELKAAIKSGTEPLIALRDALRRSSEHCGLIRCALESGLPLKLVFLAARDAGVQDSVVARCSNAACAETFRLLETDDLCRFIRSEIEKGKDPSALILEQLRKGQQACTVIKCALAASNNLEAVIRGAREARVATDIISRCCIDACANPSQVARLLDAAAVAGQPQDEFIPIDPVRPGGTKRVFLSPSGF